MAVEIKPMGKWTVNTYSDYFPLQPDYESSLGSVPVHVIVFSYQDLSNPYQLIAIYENGQEHSDC